MGGQGLAAYRMANAGQMVYAYQMHATDPAYLARRIGRPASEGCVRVPADMNRFMDRHRGVLDADYQQMATYDAAYRAILSDNVDPTPLAGDTLVVVDSSGKSSSR